jgi:hypothetical protein
LEKSQEKQDVFAAGITGLVLLFPEVVLRELTSLDSEGKNLENLIKQIKNKDLRELV